MSDAVLSVDLDARMPVVVHVLRITRNCLESPHTRTPPHTHAHTPDTNRHAASAKAGNDLIGIIGPGGLTVLCDQAAKLGVHYFDDTHLRSFKKNRKAVKKWGACDDVCSTPPMSVGWLVF